MTFALEGLRMVDFTRFQVGTMCTVLLADMGMEVIKVESARRHDGQRMLPPHPPGDEGLDSPYYGAFSRNKKSITLNVSQPKGLELVKKLIGISDLVVDNFVPGVMEKLGLSYPEIRKVKPDMVVASLCGFGATGPYKNYVAFDNPIQAFAGLQSVTGYADGPPSKPSAAVADQFTGTYGAFAILAALYHRARTGEGQFIDVSMVESMACNLPEPIMEYTMNKTLRHRRGNRDDVMVPHNVYRCRGEDEWVAIAVSDDEEWEALRGVIGKPDLDRFENEDELDRVIEEWTVNHTKDEAMHVLQKTGVAATSVLNAREFLDDPHLRERNFVVEVDHPKIGKVPYSGPTWKMSDTPGGIWRHAPSEGEHNEYVYGELLGLSQDEIVRLTADQIIY